MFYALSMAITGLMKTLLWGYAVYDHRLISPYLSPRRIRRLTRRAMIPPLVFLLSIGLAMVNLKLAKLSWGAIALMLF